MLIISKPLSAAQLRTYHAHEFSNAGENYYTAGQTIQGQWHGRLAARWGLVGPVDEAHFQRLVEGQHPLTGEALVRHQTAHPNTHAHGTRRDTLTHRAGWDATVSAPKSVSLTALVGGDARVAEAHRASVTVAIDALEPYVQARIGGNHPAETTRQWVAARFEHDSARPVDGYAAPQLHTHVVIFNMTERPTGETRALQPRELYKTQQYATAVYRAELARRLRALGYAVDRGANDEPVIRGYSTEYIEASSPRRKQITAYLEATQRRGAAAAQIAAHHTREAKIERTHEEVQHQHQELARAFGNQPAHVVAAAGSRQQRLESPSPGVTPAAAIRYATDRNTERDAVIDERAILRDALKRTMGELTLPDLQHALADSVQGGDLVAMRQPAEAPGRAFTTPEMVALEQDTLQRVQAGRGIYPELVPNASTDPSVHASDRLTSHQRAAVQALFSSRDQVMGLDGVAGSGKTAALAAIREGAERVGYRVEGYAPTSGASRALHDAGIDASTLQHLLVRQRSAPDGHPRLYILDESSLASTRQMNQFLRGLHAADRVLLVGDVRQHQAMEAGRPYEQLQEAGLTVEHLDTIVRQRDEGLRVVVERLARGEVPSALFQLEQQARIHELPARADRFEAIAEAFLEHPSGTLVVSPDNRSRGELNEVIHRRLQAVGAVDRQDTRVSVLVPRQDVTGADRRWAARYEQGNLVRYTTGSRVLGLRAGAYARVDRVDEGNNQLTVVREDGSRVSYDPRRLQGVTLYHQADRALAVGDRVQFTAPDRRRHIANRQLGTVTAITPNQALTVTLESGRTVHLTGEEPHHVDYGYAVTSYASQGQTADRVLINIETEGLGEQLVNRRLAYVAVSRARYDAQIYTDDKTQLTYALTREVSKRVALESSPKVAPSAHNLEFFI